MNFSLWTNLEGDSLEVVVESIIGILSTYCLEGIDRALISTLRCSLPSIWHLFLDIQSFSTWNLVTSDQVLKRGHHVHNQLHSKSVTALRKKKGKIISKMEILLASKYIDFSEDKALKKIWTTAIVILIYIMRKRANMDVRYRSVEEMEEQYPLFQASGESSLLLHYANMMHFAAQIIHAARSKDSLMQLCTCLTEGKGVEYITGGGSQKPAVTRREKIYETEGGIEKKKKAIQSLEGFVTHSEPMVGLRAACENGTLFKGKSPKVTQTCWFDQQDDMSLLHFCVKVEPENEFDPQVTLTSVSELVQDHQGNPVDLQEKQRSISLSCGSFGDSDLDTWEALLADSPSSIEITITPPSDEGSQRITLSMSTNSFGECPSLSSTLSSSKVSEGRSFELSRISLSQTSISSIRTGWDCGDDLPEGSIGTISEWSNHQLSLAKKLVSEHDGEFDWKSIRSLQEASESSCSRKRSASEGTGIVDDELDEDQHTTLVLKNMFDKKKRKR